MNTNETDTIETETEVITHSTKPKVKKPSHKASSVKASGTVKYKLGKNQKKFLSGLEKDKRYTLTELREIGEKKKIYWQYTDWLINGLATKKNYLRKQKGGYVLSDGIRN